VSHVKSRRVPPLMVLVFGLFIGSLLLLPVAAHFYVRAVSDPIAVIQSDCQP